MSATFRVHRKSGKAVGEPITEPYDCPIDANRTLIEEADAPPLPAPPWRIALLNAVYQLLATLRAGRMPRGGR